jgi:PEP-CTERM motif-containing protein
LKVQGHSKGLPSLIGALLVVAFQLSASAATVDVEVSGVINFHSASTSGGGYWDGTVVTNVTPYTFSLQFDSLAVDTNSDPTIGTYNSSGVPFQCSISFGDYVFTNTGTLVSVFNDALLGPPQPQDGFSFSNLNGFTQNGLTMSQGGISTQLLTFNTSLLNSDSLSEVKTLPVTDFTSRQMVVSGFFNNGSGNLPATVQGTIDSFLVTVVPEPSTWAMLGVGAVLLLGGQRLRRPRARR